MLKSVLTPQNDVLKNEDIPRKVELIPGEEWGHGGGGTRVVEYLASFDIPESRVWPGNKEGYG